MLRQTPLPALLRDLACSLQELPRDEEKQGLYSRQANGRGL